MEKQLLLKNILTELNRLPEPYLQHWYELILLFRKTIPAGEDAQIVSKEEDFDWDVLVEEVMKDRRERNLERMNRIEVLLQD